MSYKLSLKLNISENYGGHSCYNINRKSWSVVICQCWWLRSSNDFRGSHRLLEITNDQHL